MNLIMEYCKNEDERNLCRKIRRSILWREKDRFDLAVKNLEKEFKNISHDDNPFLYNALLNELEISKKKTILSSKPRQLGVNLTHNCNIRCRMCFYPDSPWDLPKQRADEIKEFLPYLRRVFWQGGEPFVSPYFKELFDKSCLNPNLRQIIVTNGLLIDKNWVKKLVSNKVTVVFSIDGVNKETYDYIRKGAKFENIIEILQTLNDYRKRYFSNSNFCPYDFEMILQATIMRYNYRQTGYFVDFARKFKFDALNIIPIQNVQGEENIFLHKDKESLEYLLKVMPNLEREARRYRIRFQNQLPEVMGFKLSSPAIKKSDRKKVINCTQERTAGNGALLCYWPWYSLYILFEGRIKPYGFCREDVEWNLVDNSLEEIWNNKLMQIYRQRIIESKTKDFCDLRCTSGIIERSQLGLEMK